MENVILQNPQVMASAIAGLATMLAALIQWWAGARGLRRISQLQEIASGMKEGDERRIRLECVISDLVARETRERHRMSVPEIYFCVGFFSFGAAAAVYVCSKIIELFDMLARSSEGTASMAFVLFGVVSLLYGLFALLVANYLLPFARRTFSRIMAHITCLPERVNR